MSAARFPRRADIRIGRNGATLSVRVYRDGCVTLEASSEMMQFCADLSRAEAGGLISALTPDKAALIDTLDLLASAADALVPSPMIHGQLCAEERECRDRIADARRLLAEHAEGGA